MPVALPLAAGMIAQTRSYNDADVDCDQRKQYRQDNRRRCSNRPADHAGMICAMLVIYRRAITDGTLSAVRMFAAATNGCLMAVFVMNDAEHNLQNQRHKR